MIEMISLADWIKLAGALLLFLGPGYALASFHPQRDEQDLTQKTALALGIAISFWAILLAWLKLFGMQVSPISTGVILGLGWAIAICRAVRHHRDRQPLQSEKSHTDWSRVALWLVIAAAIGANVWALRDVVVGPGSDSYHHTLIVQLFIDQGGIPDNYQPYAPLVTFRYHFGFHAFAAAIHSISGFKLIFLTPILAQILVPAAALTTAYLAEHITGERWPATLSATLVALVTVFPAYMINWGRYTQLAGMVLLPMLIVELSRLLSSEKRKSSSMLFVIILTAGLLLTHYRVSIMALIAGIILLGVIFSKSHAEGVTSSLITNLATLSLAVFFVVLITFPRILYIVQSSSLGYSFEWIVVKPTYFSFQRLGSEVINYPTNAFILVSSALAISWSLFAPTYRRVFIIAWPVSLLLVSFLTPMRDFLDPISTILVMFIPLSILTASFYSALLSKLFPRRVHFLLANMLLISALSLWGARRLVNIVQPRASSVTAEDLTAIEWISHETEETARFMVNMLQFDFVRGFFVGSDAGYWIPLLAGRENTSPPMIYTFENLESYETFEEMLVFYKIQDDLTETSSVDFLRERGISHIYIGERGGHINPSKLDSSGNFELVYSNESVRLYAFIP